MLDQSVNLLEELDNISKIHWLDRDDIDHIMIDFAKHIVRCMKIERISVWLLNQDRTAIVSIGEFDSRTQQFKKENILYKKNYPIYFNALQENKIIIAENIHTNKFTKELEKDYSSPLGVESLMDIPVRIAGELIGVMCFEKTGTQKIFTAQEQSFAFSVSCVLASNLEARHRRATQHKLELALIEKDLLIKEVNHRVKNNFAILISLLRISKEQGKTLEPKVIFEEYEQRIMSMLKIHDLLYQTENYTSVKLTDYIHELVSEFKQSHVGLVNSVLMLIDDIDFRLPTKNAIHMGLLISEIFLNSIKYALPGNENYQMFIEVAKDKNEDILIKIGDNGPGFDFNEKVKQTTLGLHIIKDLAEGLELLAKYPTQKADLYEFTLST